MPKMPGPPLPTPPAAVACYFGTLCERDLKPASLQVSLTPINNRHAAAGLPRPATDDLIRALRAGYKRLRAKRDKSFPLARAPFPAPTM